MRNGFVEPCSLFAVNAMKSNERMVPSQSAIAVLVPEAEALVKPFRDQYDPSGVAGVPAHITLLAPFKPPHELDAAVIDGLRLCFERFAPVRFSLALIKRFPGALYLAPEVDEPFRQLTLTIWDRFPEAPPYGGKWTTIVPHLSVAAQIEDEQQLDRIANDFAQASQGKLPIVGTIRNALLVENSSGDWLTRATLPLGHA
jgi:2'-5' RNA ligase